MTTLLESKMKEAIKKKESDITMFEWKGKKVLNSKGEFEQTSKKLIDMDAEELSDCYTHCKKMLFNEDYKNPGRYLVLEIIAEQKNRCGAELFLRFIEQEKKLSRFSLLQMINDFYVNNKSKFPQGHIITIDDMFDKVPEEFQALPLELIMDGCLDRSGAFNKKHITRTFILKQGIWLTSAESKELLECNPGNTDRLSIVRGQLGIKEVERLYINSKGINYTQMRAMLNLKPNKKYRDLTTIQLETLRNRMLFSLEETVRNHIESWERRMEEIELVAKHNEISLK